MKQHEGQPPATVDITIAADGRVFVFGLSREVLPIVAALNPRDERMCQLLGRLRHVEQNGRSRSRPNEPCGS